MPELEKAAKGPALGYVRADKVGLLFVLSWLSYFAANLGRLTYTTSLVEIIRAQGFTNAMGGMVSTGFFVCYGVGQLFSGLLGDRVPPKWMIGMSLVGTGLANLGMTLLHTAPAMLVVWCLNGLAQSMVWPPTMRVIAEYLAPELRKKACVYQATTYPVATIVAYAASAGLIWLGGWRLVFWVYAGVILAMALVWFVGFGRMEAYRMPAALAAAPTAAPERPGENRGIAKARLPVLLLFLFCGALISQGFLRDGLMSWVPTYLAETFSLGSAMAILSTVVLPVLNLAGIYATNALYARVRDESRTALCLFALAVAGTLVLVLAGQRSLPVALGAFAVVTACMMGINLMIISFVPTYFTATGRVSFVSGLTNAAVYLGSSVATYGIGAIADSMGWSALLAVLVAVAAFGGVFCLAATPLWGRFRTGKV